MGAPKPCLGYASRTAAVNGLRSQGLTTNQIAQAIGISVNTVSALECSGATRRTITDEKIGAAAGRGVTIPVDVLNALAPHAARRGCHPNTLCRAIISIIVDENMVDAILDDAEDLEMKNG